VKSWDGSGAVWFRFSTTKPSVDARKQMTWPGQSMSSHTYTGSDLFLILTL
jgi:hypothetical protein